MVDLQSSRDQAVNTTRDEPARYPSFLFFPLAQDGVDIQGMRKWGLLYVIDSGSLLSRELACEGAVR